MKRRSRSYRRQQPVRRSSRRFFQLAQQASAIGYTLEREGDGYCLWSSEWGREVYCGCLDLVARELRTLRDHQWREVA